MAFKMGNASSPLKILGIAVTGLSALTGFRSMLGGRGGGMGGGMGGGGGLGLVSGIASLVGAARGGRGGGGGGKSGSGIMSGLSSLAGSARGGRCHAAGGLDLVAALAGMAGHGGKGRGKGKCRHGASDADAPQDADFIDVTVEDGAQEQPGGLPERAKASALFLQSCIVSSSPGRVRLRHKALEASPVLEELRAAASALEGVKTAEAKPATGSLLLTFDESATDLVHVLVPLVGVVDTHVAGKEALECAGESRAIEA